MAGGWGQIFALPAQRFRPEGVPSGREASLEVGPEERPGEHGEREVVIPGSDERKAEPTAELELKHVYADEGTFLGRNRLLIIKFRCKRNMLHRRPERD